jgi:hypothetical protein
MRNNINPKIKKQKFKSFPLEDRVNLVSVFAWLIEQDKKQNPASYKFKNISND